MEPAPQFPFFLQLVSDKSGANRCFYLQHVCVLYLLQYERYADQVQAPQAIGIPHEILQPHYRPPLALDHPCLVGRGQL